MLQVHWTSSECCGVSALCLNLKAHNSNCTANADASVQVNSWAAMMVLQWGTWDHTNGMPPARSTLLEFFPTYTESAAPVGPDNLAALPVECLGLAVVSHRKAADNHLMVLGERTGLISAKCEFTVFHPFGNAPHCGTQDGSGATSTVAQQCISCGQQLSEHAHRVRSGGQAGGYTERPAGCPYSASAG